jgi:predicted acyltransferase
MSSLNHNISIRLESLDILRGLTIAGMILVNNPGNWQNTWPILNHAQWDGLTLADLVFPFFLVVMGISTALSVNNQLDKGKSKSEILQKAIIRTLKMFGIGLFLNLLWDYHWESFRIPGVLQRIAITYLFCLVAFLYLQPGIWMAYLVFSTLLALYLLKWFPPESGHGWYGLVDQYLFGKHVYQPTAPMDAEGFMSGLIAFQSGIFGMVAGVGILGLARINPWNQAITIFLIGLLIHIFLLPINKLLWTPSFALVTSGMALFLLQIFMVLEQNPVFQLIAEPFRRVGKNAILIYTSSEILEHIWIGHWFKSFAPRNIFREFVDQVSPFLYFNSLLWSLVLVSFFMFLGWILYQKKIFVKL